MKQMVPLALALTMGLAALAQAQTPNATPNGAAAPAALFREGQQVVLVGEITSSPKHVAGVAEEQKMQVAIGPAKTDYTLHLKDAQLIGQSGAKIQDNDLVNHMWVRAEGTVMDDPRRIKVTKLQVIGKDMPGLQSSAFYRPGFDQGYVMAVAGSRQIFPETTAAYTAAPMVIIGKVSEDTGPLETTRKIQVDAAGNTWTLSVPKDTPIFDVQGKKISVHQIAKGQWVRVHGWQTDDLRTRAARIENIGPEEAFRASTYFRGTEPMGYVERTPGTGVRFNPLKITGIVTAINEADNSIVVKDDNGMERTVYLETVTVTSGGRPIDFRMLQKGQQVTVEGNEILFP
jgi:RNase P/RNase MRP subunit p29